jgi:predicted nucleotidyltransferase
MEYLLQNLSPKEKDVLETYKNEIIKVYKDNLHSIILYGSILSTDFIPKISDINVAIILEKLDFEDLKKGLRLNKWIKKRISPLFLTTYDIKTSLDIFPIEFLQMKDNYQILYGKDPLKDIEVKKDDLRMECEREIKGRLIKLHQAYFEIGRKPKNLKILLWKTLDSFIPIFKNVLRLINKYPGETKYETLQNIADSFNLDKENFLIILESKKEKKKIPKEKLEEIFSKYLDDIQKLSERIDVLLKKDQ